MKNKMIFGIISFISICLIFSSYAGAQENKKTKQQAPDKISLDIKGMDIVEVLKIFSSRADMNLVIGKNVAGKVTLFLKDVDIWDAFEIVLLSNDLAYERKGVIINIMTQRDYELLYGARYRDQKKVKIVQLKYAKAADLSRALSQIKTNIGKIVVDENSGTLALIDTPEKIKEMEDFIKQTDLPQETRVYSLNYSPVDKLSAKVQDAVTKGVGVVRVDERMNKLIVTDYQYKLDQIDKIIYAFDDKTPQVIIDAQIVEITPKDEFAMGVDWDYWLKKNVRLIDTLPAAAFTDGITVPNTLAFGLAARGAATQVSGEGQYKAIVNALRVIGKTKILSSPRIMALNNQEAKILVGTKQAYITSTTSQSGTGSTVTSQSVNFVDVGIKLYVTPTINRDGFVTIKVRPEISSSITQNIISENQTTQVPIVTTSETETSIMVKDGTTILIAGLKKDQSKKEIRNIPIIGDIPLLGAFFRNKTEESTKSELVIFITPRIVSGEESVEYSSLTNDQDIVRIQALAKAIDKHYVENPGDYKTILLNKINSESNKSAQNNKGLKGEVTVSFLLGHNGQLKGKPVILSSTNKALNESVLKVVNNAAPFPSFPEDLKKAEERFSVCIKY